MLKRNHGYHHNPEAGKSYENHYYPLVITRRSGKSTSEVEVFGEASAKIIGLNTPWHPAQSFPFASRRRLIWDWEWLGKSNKSHENPIRIPFEWYPSYIPWYSTVSHDHWLDTTLCLGCFRSSCLVIFPWVSWTLPRAIWSPSWPPIPEVINSDTSVFLEAVAWFSLWFSKRY